MAFWYLLSLIALLFLLLRAKIRKKTNLPPGPPRLPLIGNLHQLGPYLHRSLWFLSHSYGPVMFLKLGTVPTVVISSADAARQVLKDRDLECCGRAVLTGTGRISYRHVDMAFSPYDHQWREMRKLFAVELFSAKKAQEFRQIREQEVASLVSSVSQSVGCSVDLSDKSFELNTSVIFKAAFGSDFGGDSRELHRVVEEAEAVIGSFFGADYFPYVGWIVDRISGAHRRLERSFRELDELYRSVIDDHLDPGRRNPEKEEDIVDVLLRIEGQEKKFGVQFGRDYVKAMLMDVFLGGVTSSAILIIWAMAEVVRNPRIMRKAQSEVRDCIGKKGKVSEGDIDGLPYLKMIVKETLRLHPPIPLLLSREVMSHCEINGYDVHPKTRLEVNVWAIGRDPDKWDNPEEFYPERFNDSPIDYRGKHFELLPFGAGRRGCPGMYMGMALVELALANLLYCFDWKLPNGMKEEDMDMEESPGLSIPKKSPLELVPITFKWS